MKLILMEDLENLGPKGTVVEVRDGYGRNYLIPRRLAVVATKSSLARFEEEQRQRAHKVEAERRTAEQTAARLDGMELTIPARVGEDERLFGTVTTQQIADELARQGYDVDRRKISLDEEIRTTGVFPATVRVHPLFSAQVKVQVVPEEASL
jgi:large subunit ribosomal protein L9